MEKYTFRELRNFHSGNLGDQCIIFRDQGSTDPLRASYIIIKELAVIILLFILFVVAPIVWICFVLGPSVLVCLFVSYLI